MASDNVDATDFELDNDNANSFNPLLAGPVRSQYHLPASEQLRGVANRVIFSKYYLLFYFVMMALSLTTVVLSLIATSEAVERVALTLGKNQCPPLAWNILEVIVNFLMVMEVSTRWIAYGKVA